jgi:hypothetical protein
MLGAIALVTPPASAQAPRALGEPSGTLAHDFSQVRGVRELPSGLVLVSDRLEQRVVLVDFATGAVRPIGRTGQGPTEYRLPTALIPMPGDSTLLVDEGNSRLAVIGPDQRIHRSFSLHVPGIPIGLGARGVDRSGNYYVQIPGWISDASKRGDSVFVVRFHPVTQRTDTVALVKGATSPPARRDGRQMGIPFVPFAAQDVWSVSLDGRLAVVRSPEFRVEWRESTGRVTRGPPAPYERIPVTDEDKVAYTRAFLANSPMSGRGPDGGMGTTPAEFLEEASVRRIVGNNTFATEKGPVTDVAPRLAPDGALWVERSTRHGAPSEWVVFDELGRVIGRYALPRGRRLAAVGRGAVYLVATDDEGLERIERYPVSPRR